MQRSFHLFASAPRPLTAQPRLLSGCRWQRLGLCGLLLLACGERAAPGPLATNGQSGSEDLPSDLAPIATDWASCPPCDGSTSAWLRANVLEVGDGAIRLELTEVLFGSPALDIGELFGGTYDGLAMCGGAVCSGIAVGDPVLAGYRAVEPDAPQCDARDQCLEALRVANPERPLGSNSCQTETQEQCSPVPAIDPQLAHLLIAPWEQELVIAETESAIMSLPQERVSFLWDSPEKCAIEWAAQGPYYELSGYPQPIGVSRATGATSYRPPLPTCQ